MTSALTSVTPATASVRFEAMGTRAHVVVLIDDLARGDLILDLARSTARTLEDRWSRFLPESDISRINNAAGCPVLVDPSTIEIVSKAIDAWHATSGIFDPTIGTSLGRAGYDRPFHELGPVTDAESVPSPTPLGVVVHPIASTISVPEGVALDLGGIGKGMAADLTVAALLDAGALGAMVNLGGDLRTDGLCPTQGWHIVIDHPGCSSRRELHIAAGGVCTSSTKRRRWMTPAGERHHILDAATGRSTDSGVSSVTVLGAAAAQCEVLATTAIGLSVDHAHDLLLDHRACGIVTDDSGHQHVVGPLGAFQ